jgi:myo-inositol-hexaphosphate 3-phosphohydrolase
MKRLPLALVLVATTALPLAAQQLAEVLPTLETPQMTEDMRDSDADDPAFWVPAAGAEGTLVITAMKNGGMRVYDLTGAEVQDIPAAPEAGGEDGRINNVDVVYGMTMADGSVIDIAVASDRGQDILRVFRIDGGAVPLVEITDLSVGRAFPLRPDPAGGADQDNPLEDQMTIYGIAGWRAADGQVWVVGTQRTTPRLGLFRLTPTADGLVRAEMVHDVRVPFSFMGQDLTIESDDDPAQDWSPQFEGVAVDRAAGRIYAGQEDVGIWLIDAATGAIGTAPLVTTRGAEGSPFRVTDSPIARDVEGLTVYPGMTESYLIASSQGAAHGDDALPDPAWDNSFAVFGIGGDGGLTYRGSFRLAATDAIDAVQESDGADVIALALPGFPNGLFVTQDGYDNDLDNLDGEVSSSNFKFVDWAQIAAAFDPPLQVRTDWAPRE